MKQKYAEEDHEHKWLNYGATFGFAIAFALLIATSFGPMSDDKIDNRLIALEEEIASMPHYECSNESFQGVVNKLDYKDAPCMTLGNTSVCEINGYFAWCKFNECYIDDAKEVCKLDKDVFQEKSE